MAYTEKKPWRVISSRGLIFEAFNRIDKAVEYSHDLASENLDEAFHVVDGKGDIFQTIFLPSEEKTNLEICDHLIRNDKYIQRWFLKNSPEEPIN